MSPVQVFDSKNNIIIPDWPAPSYVNAMVTTRNTFHQDIHSEEITTGYDYFNLALHVDDCSESVLKNRQELAHYLEVPAVHFNWLEQVHGTVVTRAETLHSVNGIDQKAHIADACTSSTKNHLCTIMTADCLPVLFCTISNNKHEQKVAAAHAGWRGLADGVLKKTLEEFPQPDKVIAWLGPAISQEEFEVGQEVYDAFTNKNPENKQAFIASQNTCPNEPKWLASLSQLAKIELRQQGIKAVYGGEYCTYKQTDLFILTEEMVQNQAEWLA